MAGIRLEPAINSGDFHWGIIDEFNSEFVLYRDKWERKKFATEMESSGIAAAIRAEGGNLKYEYFFPMNDNETVLLIDSWRDQAALDAHHASKMMQDLALLREKYDLHMRVERFISDDEGIFSMDQSFIRR